MARISKVENKQQMLQSKKRLKVVRKLSIVLRFVEISILVFLLYKAIQK